MIPCDATSEYYDVEEAKVEGISSSARYCRPTIRCLQPHRAPDSSTLQRRGAPRAERGVRDRASSETCEYRQWVILRKEVAAKRACSRIALDERHKIVPFEWPTACQATRVSPRYQDAPRGSPCAIRSLTGVGGPLFLQKRTGARGTGQTTEEGSLCRGTYAEFRISSPAACSPAEAAAMMAPPFSAGPPVQSLTTPPACSMIGMRATMS